MANIRAVEYGLSLERQGVFLRNSDSLFRLCMKHVAERRSIWESQSRCPATFDSTWTDRLPENKLL